MAAGAEFCEAHAPQGRSHDEGPVLRIQPFSRGYARDALADFLLALADFDRRRGWLELGYSGLFPFLHRKLGLSKAASFHRMVAAQLLQRFPEIIEPLAMAVFA